MPGITMTGLRSSKTDGWLEIALAELDIVVTDEPQNLRRIIDRTMGRIERLRRTHRGVPEISAGSLRSILEDSTVGKGYFSHDPKTDTYVTNTTRYVTD